MSRIPPRLRPVKPHGLVACCPLWLYPDPKIMYFPTLILLCRDKEGASRLASEPVTKCSHFWVALRHYFRNRLDLSVGRDHYSAVTGSPVEEDRDRYRSDWVLRQVDQRASLMQDGLPVLFKSSDQRFVAAPVEGAWRHGTPGCIPPGLIKSYIRHVITVAEQLKISLAEPDLDGLRRECGLAPQAEPQRRQRGEWLARALLLIQGNPGLSLRKIAAEVGVAPATLSRCREIQVAIALARGAREARPRGFIRRADGAVDVEAISPLPPDDAGEPL